MTTEHEQGSEAGNASESTAPPAGVETTEDGLVFRRPMPSSGIRRWRLVKDSGVLDENSPYFYVLYCEHHPDTCVVVERASEEDSDQGRQGGRGTPLLGFTLGHCPPARPDTVFVWQIGVSELARRRGLGRRMLAYVVDAHRERGGSYLEATVTPGNRPSRGLFSSFAERRGVPCEITPLFAAELFDDGDHEGHEAEDLFRIGPFEGSGCVRRGDSTK